MRKILLLLPFFLWTCGGGGGSTEPEPPQLPTVTNIEVTTLEDTAKTFALTGTDPNNLTLTYSISTQPQYGTISISGGAATYSPNANYNGQDVIAYLASSTSGNSNIGTIIITITPVDDEPNTMDVTATTDEDNSVQVTLEAEEYDGENIQFQVRNNPSNGTVTISGTTATYTPNENWYGTDTFNFEALDSSNRSVLNVATATITVNPINDAPIVESSNFSVFRNLEIEISLIANDIDNNNLTYSIVNQPSNGSLSSINGDTVVFSSSVVGSDSFTFKANDGTDDSNIATISIDVQIFNKLLYESDKVQNVRSARLTNDGGTIIAGDIDGSDSGFVIKLNEDYELSWFFNDLDVKRYFSSLEMSNGNYLYGGHYFTTGGQNKDGVVLKISSGEGNFITGNTFYAKGSAVGATGFLPTIGKYAFEENDGGFIVGSVGITDGQNESGVIHIFKVNENLQTIWEKTLNRPPASTGDVLNEIQPSSDGGYIVAGHSYGSNNWHPLMLKVNSSGDELWRETYTNINGLCTSVKETIDGGYVFSLYSSSNGGMLIKVDSNGNYEWDFTHSTSSEFRDVKVLTDGSFIMAGASDVGGLNVLKVDSNGSEEWISEISTAYPIGNVSKILPTEEGNFLVFANVYRASTINGWMIEIDSSGNRIY